MGHRVNVVLDDDVWERFQAIPEAERSRFINQLLSFELLRRQQHQAWEEIQALRRVVPRCPGRSEDWVREERANRP